MPEVFTLDEAAAIAEVKLLVHFSTASRRAVPLRARRRGKAAARPLFRG